MTDDISGAAQSGGPAGGLTDAERLAAVETYLKALSPIAKALRGAVTDDMAARHVERVGAYLPDGTKMAAVGFSGGRKTAKVTDPEAALKWCLDRYPGEIVKAINPAFLKLLTDAAKGGEVGEPGVDPRTGEMLSFIEVVQGDPFVTVTTTKEGVQRMEALAYGFAGMLEAPGAPKSGPGQGAQYDPASHEARCGTCGVTGGMAHDCETAGRIS